MSKPRIYISSTFFDLKDHREYLRTTLAKTESFDIVSMENYGTRSTPPAVKCIDDVKSSEFYLLLVGNRYGFIPQDSEWSITHMEYNAAIGNDMNLPGAKPNTNKCILPFILNESWQFPPDINRDVEAERKADGDQLTEEKTQKLKEWKKSIETHFTVEREGFTTPSDLTSKVLAALIFALIARNYASVVKNLKLQPELSYRCDRRATRIDFLRENQTRKGFFKVFIIHGERPDWPIFFSNNIAEYELNAGRYSRTVNLEDYRSNSPETFVTRLLHDAYETIFKTSFELTVEAFASKIIADSQFGHVVLIYEIWYAPWNEMYKKNLQPFFNKLVEANATLDRSKSCYLLINIRYETAAEKVKKKPDHYVLLERLSSIKKTHIEEWVRTYLFSYTRASGVMKNYEHDMAQKISDYYFPEYPQSASFSMEIAKDRLLRIIGDFNANDKIFSDYQNLFRP